MEYEGMVHALEEIHRLLKPDGVLIDIHPVPMRSFIKVYRRGEALFEERLPETYWEEVNRAELALAEVVVGKSPDAYVHSVLMIFAGAFFGYFRLKMKSLTVSMSIHMLANGIILLSQ